MLHEAVITITQHPPANNPNRRLLTVMVAIFHTHNPELHALRRNCRVLVGTADPLMHAINSGAKLAAAHCALLDSKCR